LTVKIAADEARNLYWTEGTTESGYQFVADQEGYASRWESWHLLVIKDADGNHYGANFALGLTEMQDHRYFANDTDKDGFVLFKPVQAIPVTTTYWEFSS
jgi:hypothetical protein